MSVTIRDLLKLPTFRDAKVVAGLQGLDYTVSSVSVMEAGDEESLGTQFEGRSSNYKQEIIITSLAEVRNDVTKQCKILNQLYKEGEIGIILYYVGYILPEISDELIKEANKLQMPIIVMPSNISLRYADAITEIMTSVFEDRQRDNNFSSEVIERLSRIESDNRSIDFVFSLLRDRTKMSIVLIDEANRILNLAEWPFGRNLPISKIIDAAEGLQENAGEFECTIEGEQYNIDVEFVSNDKSSLKLILVKENGKQTIDECKQIKYVVSTYINLWTDEYGRVDSKQLVSAIINNEPEKMRRIAQAMNFDVKSLSTAFYYYIDGEKNGSYELLKRAKKIIQECFYPYGPSKYLIDIFDDTVVVMTDHTKQVETNIALCGSIDELAENGINAKAVACYPLKDTERVKLSYWKYKKNREYISIVYPKKKVLSLTEIDFVKKLRTWYENNEVGNEFYIDIFEKISQDEKDLFLLDTLETFLLDADMSVIKTSEIMYVHKNTIKYRLKQIEKIVGRNVTRVPDAYGLYEMAGLYRLRNAL